MVSFTTRVAERILSVSSSRLRTSSIERSTTVRAPEGETGASASRTLTMSSGLAGGAPERGGGRHPERVGQRVRSQQRVGLGVARLLLRVGLLLGDELHTPDARRVVRD